jgi:hypothetical protein
VLLAVDVLKGALSQCQLSDRQLARVVRLVRSGSPKRQRKRTEELNEADRDYLAGLRGVALYRKHIPGYAKLSRWRRKAEQKRLMDSLHKRASRARAKEGKAACKPDPAKAEHRT